MLRSTVAATIDGKWDSRNAQPESTAWVARGRGAALKHLRRPQPGGGLGRRVLGADTPVKGQAPQHGSI